ncbi:MAG: hypothetical protein RJA98_1073 [Pseudomonadota bacterium]|jgi:hypothetical protein
MAFVEDHGAFLADFGVPCIAGSAQFLGLLDQPDEVLDLTRASAHSRQYQLTFITTAATLRRDDPVSVDGRAYQVREAPRQVDDGAFSTVLISKV